MKTLVYNETLGWNPYGFEKLNEAHIKKSECGCGNPEMGFNCVCEWMSNHPGEKEYSCEYCGLYTASEPQCNCCQDEGTFVIKANRNVT